MLLSRVLPLKDRKIRGVDRASLGGGSPADDKASRASSQHSLSHNIVVPLFANRGEEEFGSCRGRGAEGRERRGERASDNEPELPVHRPKTREADMHTTVGAAQCWVSLVGLLTQEKIKSRARAR